jgi:hypothetical protein
MDVGHLPGEAFPHILVDVVDIELGCGALYNLARTKLLPENFALIGVARTEESAESWRGHLHDMLESFVGNGRDH